MAEKVIQAIALMKAQGLRFFVNETLRTVSTQQAYYAQGREPMDKINSLREIAGLPAIGYKESQSIVTWTLKSRHILGEAIDVYPVKKDGSVWWGAPYGEFEKLAICFEAVGLEWGGRWKEKDLPHYQLKN